MTKAHWHDLAGDRVWVVFLGDKGRTRVLMQICSTNSDEGRRSESHCVSRIVLSSISSRRALHFDLVVSAFWFFDLVDSQVLYAVVPESTHNEEVLTTKREYGISRTASQGNPLKYAHRTQYRNRRRE